MVDVSSTNLRANLTPTELPARLAKSWPVESWRDVTVLAAVSGGADSVAMLRALATLKQAAGGAGRLLVAHFNHRMRGADADADEAFVIELSNALDLECVVGRNDDSSLPAVRNEAFSRRIRYRFFSQSAGERGARYLVTAHTADDQAETILHRAARGTGLRGLAGIPRIRRLQPGVSVVRPLLAMRRADLATYLESIGQSFRLDDSNLDLHYTRNRIRHQILPQLESIVHGGAALALARLGELACQAQQVVDDQASDLHERAVIHESADVVRIDTAPLAHSRPFLVGEMLAMVWERRDWPRQELSNEHFLSMAALLLDSRRVGDRLNLPGKICLELMAGKALLTRGTN